MRNINQTSENVMKLLSYLDSSFIYGLGSVMALNYTLWIQTSINLEEA